MSCSIEVTGYFSKQLKRLVKKYPSLKNEYMQFIETLHQKPNQGTKLSNDCYKIRLAIVSKGKGKSGGARLITHLKIIENKVVLLSIYDKSEQVDVSNKDLEYWIKNL